ncbi:hypothetical protein GCM10007928_23510 [Sulfitobacter porphyrae]|nr:hypothetical protein GCM10007928_23510 [Sulfitobacter porphyrae]
MCGEERLIIQAGRDLAEGTKSPSRHAKGVPIPHGAACASMAEMKCAPFSTAPGSLAIRFAPDPAPVKPQVSLRQNGGCETPTSQNAAKYQIVKMPRQMEGRPRARA